MRRQSAMESLMSPYGAVASPTYPFVRAHLLSEKVSYEETPFQGAAFLGAYAASRREWLRLADECARPRETEEQRVPLPLPLRGTDVLARNARSGPISLDQYLHTVLEAIGSSVARRRLAVLIQRFEVTRRLWETVDPGFRRLNDSPAGDVELYALLWLACLRAYASDGHLSYLNAALKAGDVVCSQPIDDLTATALEAARRAVGEELRTISELSRRLDVEIP